MINNNRKYNNTAIYKHRNPKSSQYYQCVSDHFEKLDMVWEARFEGRYGFQRSWTQSVIYRYLDCGDLHCGFARVKCKDCGHEYLLAFVLEQSGNPAASGTSVAIFARHAIRSGWWNLVSGCVKRC